MTPKETCRRVGLSALIFGASIMLALALATPPSPFAAADRLFARAAWEFFAPPRPQSR